MSVPGTCIYCGGSMSPISDSHPEDVICSKCQSYYENGEWHQDPYADLYAPLKNSSGGKTPKACEACGGPYPLCKDGCAIFDDN